MIAYKESARQALEAGLDALADTVKITLGPKGRNAILGRADAAPLITNDGVTIAKEVDPEESFTRMGARLVQEVSAKTNEMAGDGTSTATLLMQVLVHEGLRNMAAGANPVLLRRGMQKGANAAAEAIRRQARKLGGAEEIARVAEISSGDESVGKMLSDIMSKLTADGVITIEESKTPETSYNVTLGMQFNRGYVSPHMITDKEKMKAVAENAYLLITDKRISAGRDIVPVLEYFANSDKNLVIIADEFEGEALNTICYNCVRGVVHVLGVRAPAYGDGRKESLKDLAALTGAAYVSEELGIDLKDVDMSMLGRATRVEATQYSTIISGGGGRPQEIRDRVSRIRNQLELSNYEFDRKRYRERLARMLSGVAVIRVGADSEMELQEKKLRMEDALNATRAAVAEGIVPGGGTAFLNAIPAVEELLQLLEGDEKTGASAVVRALEAPARQIAENAGYDGAVVVEKIRSSGQADYGFDAYEGVFYNMMEKGIIDPAKVSCSALESAVSVAALALTTDAMVTDSK